MEYLLIMSLSGSVMTGILLFTRGFLKDRLCAGFYYVLARAAVLYYLIPLPFLKKWYRAAAERFLTSYSIGTSRIPLTRASYALHAEEELYVNFYAKAQTIAVIVWVTVACLILAAMLWDYLRKVRRFAACATMEMSETEKEVLARLQNRYGIKRKIRACHFPPGACTMTFGVIRPFIVSDRELESPEGEMLLCHELVHIRRFDVLWKFLMQSVVVLHWWNLMAWLLYLQFERVCEMSCDETAVRGKSKDEVKAYLRLLIEEAKKGGGKKNKKSIRWRAGFGGNTKRIRERMDNLMKNRKWNRVATGVLAAVLVFANSITVFAYRDTVHREIQDEITQEIVEEKLVNNELMFVPDGADVENTEAMDTLADGLNDEIDFLYDRQFVDEEGNIYPAEDGGPYRGCNHNFVQGKTYDHLPYADGGCKVCVYDSERCTKCGYIIDKSLISTTTFTVCPH